MFLDSDFMRTQDILQRSMSASLIRQEVIANNIANADTPNFKRSDVAFESELARALSSYDPRPFPEAITDKRHIPFFRLRDYREIKPIVYVDYTTTYRNDGNNVDIEKEMVDAKENALRYTAMAQRVSDNFKLLSIVMK
ncbi:MAG: flagellar basal body rod protein FlgB [Spirochaetes bacterium]|nr:MAG: flagellar basal body rod protein FlgB [Spirochaetota bacterium]